MLEKVYDLPSLSQCPVSGEIRLEQKWQHKNDPLLSLRHPIQVRVINKIASVSHDSSMYPAKIVTATTTMEVIQDDQLISAGQVPLRPPSKGRQEESSLHLPHCTSQGLQCHNLSPHLNQQGNAELR